MKLGKRTAGKNNADYLINDLYRPFIASDVFGITLTKKLDPDRLKISEREFTKMIRSYLNKVMTKIIEEGKVYEVPFSLGTIKVEKKRMKMAALLNLNQLKVDWAATHKAGKKIYHLNEHRNHHRYGIRWFKKSKIKGQGIYSFIGTRFWKRRLAQILKTNPKMDYYE